MRISDWSSDVCSSDLWRLDAACLVDLLGHLEGRFQFGAAVLLHELVALGLLFGFGLREREVEAWRHSAEEHFHALGEDDALGEFPRLFARRKHQRLLRGREFAGQRSIVAAKDRTSVG